MYAAFFVEPYAYQDTPALKSRAGIERVIRWSIRDMFNQGHVN